LTISDFNSSGNFDSSLITTIRQPNNKISKNNCQIKISFKNPNLHNYARFNGTYNPKLYNIFRSSRIQSHFVQLYITYQVHLSLSPYKLPRFNFYFYISPPPSFTMLPYQTLEEYSKYALGRNLTFGETLWFNYSAKKSDLVLHCHNTLFLCLFYSIAPIPFLLIELSGYKKLNKYKIQPLVKRTFWEMFKCYKYVMWTFIIAVGPLQIISYPTIKVCKILLYFFLFRLLLYFF
jgi:hypothetical protein